MLRLHFGANGIVDEVVLLTKSGVDEIDRCIIDAALSAVALPACGERGPEPGKLVLTVHLCL